MSIVERRKLAVDMNEPHVGPIPFIVAVAYVLAIYVSAAMATCKGQDTIPYGYAFYFRCDEIINLAYFPAAQIAALFLGFYSAKILLRRRLKTNFRIRLLRKKIRFRNASYISLAITALIAVYVLFLALTHDAYDDPDNWRAISSKASQLLLVVSGFSVSVNIASRKFTFWAVFLLFVIAATVLVADASRAAAIPIGIAAVYSGLNSRYVLAILFSGLILPILGLARAARGFFASGERGIEEFWVIIANAEYFGVGYLAAYSFVHIFVVLDTPHVTFSVSDLFYSIIPLPSSLHFISHNLEDWRIDVFRPMSAMSQIVYLGFPPFLVFNFLVGVFFSRVAMTPRGALGVLGSVFLLLFFLMSHQYLLRGVMWFFYIHLFIIFLASKNKGRM